MAEHIKVLLSEEEVDDYRFPWTLCLCPVTEAAPHPAEWLRLLRI